MFTEVCMAESSVVEEGIVRTLSEMIIGRAPIGGQ
jgi:hypothetical protein